MYADRLEANTHRSIKDRLNGNSSDPSTRRLSITGKRQRQDDKWEHDLYEDDKPQTSNRKVDPRDLRLKLQKKSQLQSGNSTFSGVRDLREKLSGTMKPQAVMKDDPPKPKLEVSKPNRKNDSVEARPSTTQKVAVNPATRKRAAQKSNTSVDDFLQSLGLEKYSITFQAEEVDMTALVHMGDEDLKALGVPMGPRKKILLALESRV